eukprot:tig00021094_g18102.t1
MLTQQLAASVQQATASAVAAAVAPLTRDLSALVSAVDQQRMVLAQHQSLLEHAQRPAPAQVTHLPLEAPAPLPAPGTPPARPCPTTSPRRPPPSLTDVDISQAVSQALARALPAALAGPASRSGPGRLFLDPVFSPSATQSGLASSAADAIAVSLDPVSGRLVLQAHSASSSTGTQREQLAFPDLLLCLQLLAFQISTDTMLPAEERCRRLEALSRLQYEIIVLARTLPWERDADGRYRALATTAWLSSRAACPRGARARGPLPFHAGSIVASAAAVDAAARPAGGGRASRASAAARPAAASAVAALASPPGTAPSGDTRAASGSGRSRSRAVQDALDRGAVWHTEDPRYFSVSPAICWCFNQGICKNAVSDGVCFFGRHICAQCHSRDHPDGARRTATGAGAGFTRGFPLLYRGPPYSAVHRPHPTALEHLDAVRADVAKERAAGRMAGPFPHPPFAPFVASPLGAVPKKRSNPPKWRRITDLSYPRFRGFSVNRGIDNAPLHYTSPSVADAIELIISLGRLTQLGKADVRDAFRLLPDPARPGAYDFYYDMALPFGGRSSHAHSRTSVRPSTTPSVGGVLFLRYVDDILVLGRPGTAECARSMEALQAICSHLGIPLAAEKLEGPSFRLVFLGIELDTDAMEARLSAGRYEDLVSLLGSWEGKRHATRHDLQSLAGLLTSATAVIPPGRFFLQRVLSLISALREDHHRATLHPGFHADLRWWRFLLAERHGVRLLPASARWADSRELRLETDASGVGFGAVFGDAWLFGAWADHPDIPASMPWRELMAIVIAAATWGPQWHRRRINFHTDCEPVALAIANGYSPRPGFATLLRTLYALSVLHSFEFRATHIAGLSNVLADPLSRLQIEQFRRLHRSYSYPQREFIEFCLQRGLHDRQGSVLPASEATLCFFAAHLFRRGGVAPPSIRTYITAVQSLHVDSGFSTFWGSMPRLARLLEGIARVADPRPKLRRDPITRGQLSDLAQYAAAHPSPETRLLWAAFSTAFFGFFRCSEVCAVRLPVPDPARLFQRRDLRFFTDEGESFARLRLKKSKTDQRGQGCDVDIPIRPLLPHSFRIGAATAAFEAGLPDYAIQLLGRWRSDAFQLYIRARPELVRRQRGLLLASSHAPPAAVPSS